MVMVLLNNTFLAEKRG